MRLRFGKGAVAALALGAAAMAGAALAHDQGPQPNTPAGKAAGARHQNFKQLGGAFKAVMDEAKKDSPNQGVVAANAKKIDALARQLPSWFPKGSGPDSGAKTDAKPQVWSDPQGFAAAAQRLQAASAQLQQVASAGDVKALRAQTQALGGACKNCHDKYKVEDKR